jgi:hypothetical protein
MKAKMLKIAGVKSEKDFYKKFPDEASFMAKHGGAFKKAQIGAYIGGEQGAGFQPVNFKDIYDEADYAVTGSTEDQRREEARRDAEVKAAQQQGGGAGGGGGLGNIAGALGNIGKMFGEEGGGEMASAIAGARKGKNIKKAQGGTQAQPEPQQSDYPDYQTWKSDHDLWRNGQTYVGMSAPPSGTISTAPASIPNPGAEVVEKTGGDKLMKAIGKYAGPAGKVVEGIQQLKEEKRALERAEQARDVSGLVKQAASTRPEETQRRYVRPEDVVNTGEEFFPIYGVGTNVLAKNGASVGGGEIMNTFAPNTLYDDLGYEPLNDSERYKQFMHGGKMHKAQNGDWMEGSGFYNFAKSGGADATGQLLTGITGENAGGNLGGTIGGVAGSFFGPAGKLVGQAAGQLIGSAIDRKPQQIKKAKEATQRNIQSTALQQGMQGGQAQYSSFMKDGGTTSPYEWVSHTWQPQVIASFGEHKVKDLLRPPKDADMLRAGGHLKEYTPPSAAAMSTERPDFQMGGELKTHWGGYAEPMSYNPYLPDGGETIMFRGQSHDESDGKGNTGIGITYGENPVEVERGEPALKLKDGGGAPGDSSLVVFGNLKIPKAYVPFLGKEAEGKKFKTYVADLSKKENKINKNISKAVEELDELDVQTPFDKLRFNSLDLTINGGNATLKEIADSKTSAASLQNAINDTAEEYGFVADDLAKGKVKTAKFGKMIKAQAGYTSKYGLDPWTGDKSTGIKNASAFTAKEWDEIAEQIGFDKTGKKGNKAFQEYLFQDPELKSMIIDNHQKLYNSDPTSTARNWFDNKLGAGWAAPGLKRKDVPETPSTFQTREFKPIGPGKDGPTKKDVPSIEYNRSGLVDIIGQALPYIRPTDQEQLDPTQLMGEMYALATNQLEPVQAQTLQPRLDVPYDISLQDQLNENEASFRSQQRLMGYNPAAQAQLNAQKYQANQRVLGEQFRMNQAMKNQVYRDNRNLLNQYDLQNLAIFDKQYERQATAKSKTKATTQAALNSIGDKYMRNQLENRTLATMENMYNYRFDPRFRAVNMNAPFQPVIPTIAGTSSQRVPVLDQNGNVLYYEQKVGDQSTAVVSSPATTPGTPQTFLKKSNKEEIEAAKKGASVKKKNLNSSIVKALKNI